MIEMYITEKVISKCTQREHMSVIVTVHRLRHEIHPIATILTQIQHFKWHSRHYTKHLFLETLIWHQDLSRITRRDRGIRHGRSHPGFNLDSITIILNPKQSYKQYSGSVFDTFDPHHSHKADEADIPWRSESHHTWSSHRAWKRSFQMQSGCTQFRRVPVILTVHRLQHVRERSNGHTTTSLIPQSCWDC